jgi:hypothetical protein
VIWNLYRFAVKVTNNLFTNFGRFLIFSLGGYLALKGELELGAWGPRAARAQACDAGASAWD